MGENPDFLYAALDTTACAAFSKESRINFTDANKLHRKSGEAAASIIVHGLRMRARTMYP
jgi:hypothetical protein